MLKYYMISIPLAMIILIILFIPMISYQATIQKTGTRNPTYTVSEWYRDSKSNTCINVTNEDNQSGSFSASVLGWSLAMKPSDMPLMIFEVIYNPIATFTSNTQTLGAGQTGKFILNLGNWVDPIDSNNSFVGYIFQPRVSTPQIQYSYNQNITKQESIIQFLSRS